MVYKKNFNTSTNYIMMVWCKGINKNVSNKLFSKFFSSPTPVCRHLLSGCLVILLFSYFVVCLEDSTERSESNPTLGNRE